MDGTFKVVREPFVQLVSLHAFVRRDACEKQVPLAFVVMSRRTAPDYTAALQAVIDALPSHPAVKTITTDFEKGIWRGCREVLPEVKIRGCGFHWAQAVERYFGEVGLLTAYKDKAGPLRDLLRKLLALPYLPLRDTSSLQPLGGCGPGPRRCPTSEPFQVRAYELAGVQCVVSWGLVCLQSACED